MPPSVGGQKTFICKGEIDFFNFVSFFKALPRQRIQLAFDKNYYIEPSFECRFDHIEIRDGPFGFSPLIDRFCGGKNPGLVTSTGRFMWIKFTSDEELEGLGFRIKYTFVAGESQCLHLSRAEGSDVAGRVFQ